MNKLNHLKSFNEATENLNISDVISSKFNNIKCKLLGHNFIYVGRSNGNIWGWNEYKCKNCGAKMDSLD